MQHIENALTVLAEWGKAPQCNGIVRGYVYDYDDQLIYRGNGAGLSGVVSAAWRPSLAGRRHCSIRMPPTLPS